MQIDRHLVWAVAERQRVVQVEVEVLVPHRVEGEGAVGHLETSQMGAAGEEEGRKMSVEVVQVVVGEVHCLIWGEPWVEVEEGGWRM